MSGWLGTEEHENVFGDIKTGVETRSLKEKSSSMAWTQRSEKSRNKLVIKLNERKYRKK